MRQSFLSRQRYNLTPKYVKGPEILIADLLSRATDRNSAEEERAILNSFFWTTSTQLKASQFVTEQLEKIRQATLNDPALQKLCSVVVNG